jgi:undecaprenyl pyrophosphate phosphatase UppP
MKVYQALYGFHSVGRNTGRSWFYTGRNLLILRAGNFMLKLLWLWCPPWYSVNYLDDLIDEKLGSPAFIAWMFIAGGIVLLFIDKFFSESNHR